MSQEAKDILIVDDVDSIRSLIRIVLESVFFTVHEARDGKSAMEMAKTINPDLVLLDIYLPDVNCETVLESLSRSEPTKRTPVILMSGMHSGVKKNDLHPETIIGAKSYHLLEKPFHPDKLISLVRLKLNLR